MSMSGLMLNRIANTLIVIGRKRLDREPAYAKVTDDMYALLDSLVEQAKPHIEGHNDREAALHNLKVIHDLLMEANVVFPPAGARTGDLLSQSRTPENEGGDLSSYMAESDNVPFLYLTIAETLNLPIFMIEAPEHNFVRWYFEDGTYLNWETAAGEVLEDSDYIDRYGIPEDAVERGIYLSPLTESEIIGRCYLSAGTAYANQKKYRQAIESYTRSTKFYGMPNAWGNLAWLLVTCPEAESRDGAKAIVYARHAVSIFKTGATLHTLACAYAEAGEFDKAVALAEEAYHLSGKQDYLDTIKGLQKGESWAQQHEAHPHDCLKFLMP